MKGDPPVRILCPFGDWSAIGRAVSTRRRGRGRTTRPPSAMARGLLHRHLMAAHPELGVRERSELVAEARIEELRPR